MANQNTGDWEQEKTSRLPKGQNCFKEERLLPKGLQESNPLSMLMNLLLSEKSGIAPNAEVNEYRDECDKLAKEAASTLVSA